MYNYYKRILFNSILWRNPGKICVKSATNWSKSGESWLNVKKTNSAHFRHNSGHMGGPGDGYVQYLETEIVIEKLPTNKNTKIITQNNLFITHQ